VSRADVKAVRRMHLQQLNALRGWKTIRDETTGHVGADMAVQVPLLAGIDIAQVGAVFNAYAAVTEACMEFLRDALMGDA
jgi:hypothetical protein